MLPKSSYFIIINFYGFMVFEVFINFINGISLVLEPNRGLTLKMNYMFVTVL
jgi:hypothetical protein